MDSKNFEILREEWPELATLGGFAEHYTFSDSSSALIKLRLFCETLAKEIYRIHKFIQPYQPKLFELLDEDAFKAAIPAVVIDKFHIIRLDGNKAAHGQSTTPQMALTCLQEAWDLARWLYISYGKGKLEECEHFNSPAKDSEKETLAKLKKTAQQKIAEQEQRLEELLEQVDLYRAKAEAITQPPEHLQMLKTLGQSVANTLSFNEADTRSRLIDKRLVDAGWNVGHKGVNTEEVGQEIEVLHQPTETGKGYADYVLWDDSGKPLAVIEAKKTSASADIGQNQAKYYADGLEKGHGQRPVIFYTNGYDIFIWDDAQKYPPRQIDGYYSKDSLRYLVNYQRKEKQLLEHVGINPSITDRDYQQEAIRRCTEKFSNKYRKALIIQATGTGKTRVAISLTDLLIRAKWVKRVLFVCDRKELRKQAKQAFGEHLKDASSTIVTNKTHNERQHRIYLATYPTMSKYFNTYDVGFFDLIIADESHRSIYNRYRDIFLYFDCLQVGLTATPVNFIGRNTYRLFGCEDKDPTCYYSLEDAVEAGHLSPYEVFTHTTKFLRQGIKYDDLTDEQKQQLEEDGEDPEEFNYHSRQIDKVISNKDTNRSILENLMDNGIRNASGQHVGKSIIFARNHRHAILLKELFDEMYPQYGGKFCKVIDNYDPRAEQLIDDFKNVGDKDEITIAISVDMLDTGIDVPEIVNLSFAKPIRSQVKFEQMIGRGTRLCPNLFGPGEDKGKFRIFDHWGNFEYFSRPVKVAPPGQQKSLMQLLFEARINLASAALEEQSSTVFSVATQELGKMIKALPEKAIAVRRKWRQVHSLQDQQTLKTFSHGTVKALEKEISPLMQWININKQTDAYRLDLLMSELEIGWLKRDLVLENKKRELRNGAATLPINLNQVLAKETTINNVKSDKFWETVDFKDLEKIRLDLREIWQYRPKLSIPTLETKVIDIIDGGIETAEISSGYATVDMVAYKKRVEEALKDQFSSNPILQKIRKGTPVTSADLHSLTSLILTQNPDIDLNTLKSFYDDTVVGLDFIIRSMIGMDENVVEAHFEKFRKSHNLNADQHRFMSLLKRHIAKYGSIEIDKLYEPPFTGLDSDGVDGVFPDEEDVDALLDILATFNPKQAAV
ncbi:MAG: type I restriction enzyme R subunit [Desulforhopalus sp.]|jgi:type I restriction enzyme R subunit